MDSLFGNYELKIKVTNEILQSMFLSLDQFPGSNSKDKTMIKIMTCLQQ